MKLELKKLSAQNDTASFERPTDSYTDLSLKINRRIDIADTTLTVFVYGRNLSDQEQRQHTSFVEGFAPAAGGRIEFGVRYQF